jgi:hypothetical protein
LQSRRGRKRDGEGITERKNPQIMTVPTGPKPECSLTSGEESPTATDQCNHAKEIGVVKNVLRNGNGSKAEV